jgi:hypothetical protein
MQKYHTPAPFDCTKQVQTPTTKQLQQDTGVDNEEAIYNKLYCSCTYTGTSGSLDFTLPSIARTTSSMYTLIFEPQKATWKFIKNFCKELRKP